MSAFLFTIGAILAGLLVGWLIIRIAEYPPLGAVLLVFFLPFERIPTLDLAGTTIRINHLVGGATFLIWLVLILLGRRTLYRQGALPFLGIFFAALLLSLLSATELSRSLVVVFFTAFTMIMAILMSQLVTNRDVLRKSLIALAATTLLAVGFGFYQFVGDLAGLPAAVTGLEPGYSKAVFGFPRIQSFGTEPLFFGNFLLLPISLGLSFLLMPQRWFPRSAAALVFVAALATLILTLSRGAILGLFGVGLVTVVLLAKRIFSGKPLAYLLGGLIVAFVAVGGIFAVLGERAQEQFVSHVTVQDFGKSESTVGRLLAWRQAYELWQTAPVTGIGPGNFGPAILGYPPKIPATGWPVVNNEYVELLAETGVIGIGTFFIFLGVLATQLLRAYWRTSKDPELRATIVGLTAAFVGMLIQYNFFSTLYMTPVWVTLGLLMAAQALARDPVQEVREKA